jgi:thiamine biosynthesis lipoprotein
MTDGTASLVFDAIGSRWEIETDRPLRDDLRARIRDRIDRFDATWSRFRPDSLVTRIAGACQGGRYRLPDDASALLDIYDRLHELTGGALDPLIGRDLELLGYDASYSLTPATGAVRQREHQRRARWPDVQRDAP